MEFKEIFSENLKRKFEITIPRNVIEKKFKNIIEEKIKTKVYPGFRLGKAPFSYVENQEKDIIDSVIIEQVYSAWQEIKEKEKIVIFNNEETIEDVDIDLYKNHGGDVKFVVECELLPDLPEIKFEEIVVKKKKFDITDEDVTKYIEKVKSQEHLFKEAGENYKAKQGDIVILDIHGKIDSKSFSGGDLADFRLCIGSGKILKDLEDAIIGMGLGESKSVKLTFPEDYHDRDIAGKGAVFDIAVKKIDQAIPLVDESDLLKKFDCKTIEELKTNINGTIKAICEDIIRSDIRKQIEDELEKYDFLIPSSLLNAQKQTIKNKNIDQDEDDQESAALRAAKLSLIFAKFAMLHNINLKKEDVVRYLSVAAAKSELPPNYLLMVYNNNKDFARSMNVKILEDKMILALIGTVKKEEVDASVSEIMTSKLDVEAAEGELINA